MIIATIVIMAGGIILVGISNQNSLQVKTSNTAKAYVADPTSYDWGNIAYSGPKAKKSFTIKNTGTTILELYNISTSCHCTQAILTIDGQDSPEFRMGNISSYVGKVKPGDNATLTVIFDPAFHGPSGIGPINRFVEVETNDRSTPKLTFTLTGVVVNK